MELEALPKTRAEAREAGSPYYFTGVPCKSGHLAYRKVSSKNCIECHRRIKRESYRRNPTVMQAYQMCYRELNADYISSVNAEKYQAEKERIKLERRSYRASHPEHVKQLARERYAKDRVRHVGYVRNREARKRAADGVFTSEDIRKLFNKQNGRCQYCCCSLGKGFQIDHVISLIRGGSNWPSNLALACQPCNGSKMTRSALDYVLELVS